MRSRRVPVDNALRRVSRFILQRLHIARKECGHEQNGRENQQQFQSGYGALDGFHESPFDLTLYRKVSTKAIRQLTEDVCSVTAELHFKEVFAPNSQQIDCAFTGLAGYWRVIPRIRQIVPLKLATEPASLMEFASSAGVISQTGVAPAGLIHAEVGRYRLRLAETRADREAACWLRFKVFNIEFGEGLESSYETGLETGPV